MHGSWRLTSAVAVHPVYILFLVLEDLAVQFVNQPSMAAYMSSFSAFACISPPTTCNVASAI